VARRKRSGAGREPGAGSECANANSSEAAQAFIELRDGLDSAEIIFQSDVLVRGVRVFVGQPEAQQDAGHLERVVHLRDKRNRSALADKNGALAKTFFKRTVRHLKIRMRIGRDP